MKKLRNMLRQPELHACLAFLFFVLICLPFLIFPGKNEDVNMFDKDMFSYFFVVWGAVIVVLFFIAKSLKNDPAQDRNSKGDSEDV